MYTSCLVLFYTSQPSLLMGTMDSIFTKSLFESTVHLQGLKTMQLYVGSKKGDPPACQVYTALHPKACNPRRSCTGTSSE